MSSAKTRSPKRGMANSNRTFESLRRKSSSLAVDQVLKVTGGGAHGVLVTAVSPPAFAQALSLVRRRFSWDRVVDALEEAGGYAWGLAA